MGQRRPELEHLRLAAALPADGVEALRTLATQLEGEQVVPLLGAGASYDCGMLLAGQLAQSLHEDYLLDDRFLPHPCTTGDDLGAISEAIYGVAGQSAVVEMLKLPDPALWPDADNVDAHFCAYRVLARLAREQLFDDTLTLNYDCNYEAGLKGEGFLLASDVRGGTGFRDHVKVMADRHTSSSTASTAMVLRKIHGSAQRYRTAVEEGAHAPEDDIVIRTRQLQDWTGRDWAAERLRAIARESVMLMIGFSARDAVIVDELADLLGDVYRTRLANGVPRIIAMDFNTTTPELRRLVEEIGLNGAPLAAGHAAFVETADGTTTAALLVLLTEMLAHRLAPMFAAEGYVLPENMEARLGALTLAGPTMLRWAFLLLPSKGLNHPNLHRAGDDGYVPLRLEPHFTARVLRRREKLRRRLGLTVEETFEDLMRDHGFIVPPGGVAYLPTGLSDADVAAACRPAGPTSLIRHSLAMPRVDCVMIGEDRGFNLETGKEVKLP